MKIDTETASNRASQILSEKMDAYMQSAVRTAIVEQYIEAGADPLQAIKRFSGLAINVSFDIFVGLQIKSEES